MSSSPADSSEAPLSRYAHATTVVVFYLFVVASWAPRMLTIGDTEVGLSALLLATMGVLLPVAAWRGEIDRQARRLRIGMLLAMAFLLAWGYLGVYGLDSPFRAGRLFLSLGQGLILMLVITRVLAVRHLRRGIALCALMLGLSTALSLYNYLGGAPADLTYLQSDRASALFKNPNQFGMVAAMAVPFAIALCFQHGRALAGGALLAITATALLLAASKTNLLLALLLALTSLCYVLVITGRARAILIALPLCIGLVAIAGMPLLDAFNPRAAAIVQAKLDSGNVANSTLEQRYKLWAYSIDVMQARPLFGEGTGQPIDTGEQSHSHSHNVFLDLGRTLGLPGFFGAVILLMLIGWTALHTLWRIARLRVRRTARGPGRTIVVGAALAVLSYLVSNQMSDSLGPSTSVFLWIALGITLRRHELLFLMPDASRVTESTALPPAEFLGRATVHAPIGIGATRRAALAKHAAAARHYSGTLLPAPIESSRDDSIGVHAGKPRTPPRAAGLRVVHVVTRLLRAGSEENTIASCLYQRSQGSEVYLLFGRDYDPELLAELAPLIHCVRVPELVHPIHPLMDVRAWRALRRHYDRIRPDIVHTHQSKAGVIGRLAADPTRIGVVHTVHIAHFENVGFLKQRLYVTLERICSRRTHEIINVSAGVRQACLQHGIGSAERHHVIHSGMDLERFRVAETATTVRATTATDPSRPGDAWPDDPDAFVVLMLAAFEPRKRQESFLVSMTPALRRTPRLHVVFCGQGTRLEACRTLVDDFGLIDQVHFAGHVKDVERWVAAADLCVLTSEREGLPRVLVQYAAAGKPIVVNHLAGIEEIVRHGHNGVVVPADDLFGIALEIERLMDDPRALDVLVRGARSVDVSRWEVNRMGAGIQSLYERLNATLGLRRRAALKQGGPRHPRARGNA